MNSYNNSPPTGTKINFSHPQAKGLVGFWAFNEAGGTKLIDYTTNISCDVINGAYFKQGILYSDGSNDYVNVGNYERHRIEDDITIFARVKIIALPASFGQIIMKNSANSNFYGLLITSTGKVYTQFTGASTLYTSTLSINTWYNLVGVRSRNGGTGNCKLFINGIQDATTGTTSSALATGSTNLNICRDAVNGRYLNANVACIGLYNRVLSLTEIRLLQANPYLIFKK